MPVVQQGAINTTALIVPDLYVQVVPPQNLVLNGVPTNIIGMVGTASWGPVGEPVIVSTMADYSRNFGPLVARQYDMGTPVATAVQQGAQDFRCVRVTDGSDTAAQGSPSGSTVTFTALHTGTLGNQIVVSLQAGSKAAAWRLAVGLPGGRPELYDNITGVGATLWLNLAAAVNTGQGPQRGPSRLIAVNAGGATVAPSGFTLSLGSTVPGTDGITGVGTSQLIGQDGASRTGLYALRGQGCGIVVAADTTDPTSWTAQAAFGLQEGAYTILAGPPGDTIQNAISVIHAAGLDSYAAKLMFGDWLWWSDQTNGTIRLVSPQGFVAGRLANLSPEQSSLNKPLYGILGSQNFGVPGSGQTTSYSVAELSAMLSAGIDVICNPQPAGNFWGVRGGRNSSSNVTINGDNYTRLTNYISATLAAGMGLYVGKIINASLLRQIRATLLSFLQNMLNQGMLGSVTGALPFSVICDASNNPVSRTGLGYVQADIQVQYQAINEIFLINLEGGQTVSVSTQTLPSGQPA
jgi:phage tail sheath protein FI